MSWLLQHITQHKDALIAIAALASPFVAMFAALVASKRAASATTAASEQQRQTSLEVAERNARITVRATNRQNWINELREEIAQFLSVLPAAHGFAVSDATFNRSTLQQQVALHYAKISLLINPQKCEYDSLLKFLDEAMNHAAESLDHGQPNSETLAEDRARIVAAAQAIFRSQWERVKRLE